MNIQWTCVGKDKHGEIVKITLANARDADEARHHADTFHFGAMRRIAIDAGAEDPELKCIEGDAGVIRVGEINTDFGQFKPPGVKPIDLDKYVPRGKKRNESTDDIQL